MRCLLSSMFLAGALLSSMSSSAQMNLGAAHYSITGRVEYASQGVAEKLLVELRSGRGIDVAQTMTDAEGEFAFMSVEGGAYTVNVNVAGYEPVSLHVDVSFGSSKGNNVVLKERSQFSAPSASGATISQHELSMPENARLQYEEARQKLYKEKDALTALKRLQAAVKEAPQFYEAYHEMGIAYLTLGKRDEAEKSERKAMETSGETYAEAYFALGSIFLDGNRTAEAQPLIRRGLKLAPDAWIGHYELGRALLNENRINEAEECALQARKLAPNAPLTYRLLANIHLREGDSAALMEDLDAYLKLDPDSPAGVRAKQLRAQVRGSLASATGAGGPSKP